jgi:hypothetical protein
VIKFPAVAIAAGLASGIAMGLVLYRAADDFSGRPVFEHCAPTPVARFTFLLMLK